MTDATTTVQNSQTDQPQAGANPQDGQQPPAETIVIDGREIPADLSKVQDPDLREHYQAIIDANKEDEAAKAGQHSDGQQPAGQDQQQQPPALQGQAKPPPQPIPVAALHAERTRRETAEANANYYKGLYEATAAGVKPVDAGQTQPPQQTPEQKLTAIHGQIDALAEKFDAGELTMKEYKAQERVLEGQAQAIRDVVLLARVPRPEQQQLAAPADDLLLEERTAALETQHPYVLMTFPETMPTDPTQRENLLSRQELLRAEARAALRSQGLQNGPRADLLFRQKIAELSDQYGPMWFPNAQVQRPSQQTPVGTQTNGQRPLTTRQQNRFDKIVTAGQQPPDITRVGQQGTQTEITEADIEKMSEDELARLPKHVLEKHGIPT